MWQVSDSGDAACRGEEQPATRSGLEAWAGWAAAKAGHAADSTVAALQEKVENLEALNHSSNIRVVGIAELMAVDNMELFVERLLIRLLGCETFSNIL
ncbi:hypothetical protein NDU88_003300 [Pleurodeles waltl]|uniref:Uncharacterized protein n=1 Tax=Pleurodeles waltl TaxID=8319 RepID=A0AAV7VG74_PLEWA|nr:hypothetical protein NDU88_003300 [Pleurodeles waltl]